MNLLSILRILGYKVAQNSATINLLFLVKIQLQNRCNKFVTSLSKLFYIHFKK